MTELGSCERLTHHRAVKSASTKTMTTQFLLTFDHSHMSPSPNPQQSSLMWTLSTSNATLPISGNQHMSTPRKLAILFLAFNFFHETLSGERAVCHPHRHFVRNSKAGMQCTRLENLLHFCFQMVNEGSTCTFKIYSETHENFGGLLNMLSTLALFFHCPIVKVGNKVNVCNPNQTMLIQASAITSKGSLGAIPWVCNIRKKL